IAIIIVLASLLLAAVFKGLDLANEAATRTETTQLAAAIESFKTKNGAYPPSRIILCKNYANYFNGGVISPSNYITPLHQDSVEFLQRVFPRITTTPAGQPGPIWATVGIDWNQTGQPDPPMPNFSVYPVGMVTCNGYMLEGEQ